MNEVATGLTLQGTLNASAKPTVATSGVNTESMVHMKVVDVKPQEHRPTPLPIQFESCFFENLSTSRPLERRGTYDYDTHRQRANRLLVVEPVAVVADNLARIVRAFAKDEKGHILWSDLVFHIGAIKCPTRRFEVATAITREWGTTPAIERLFSKLHGDERFGFLAPSARAAWSASLLKPPPVEVPPSPTVEKKSRQRGQKHTPRSTKNDSPEGEG